MARTSRFEVNDFSRSRVRHDIRDHREETYLGYILNETDDLVTEYYDVRRLMDKL